MKTTDNNLNAFLSLILVSLMIGIPLLAPSGISATGSNPSPGIAAMLTPSSTSSPGSTALAATIYVDDDNWADPMQDGSEEHPYDTINEALDDAENGDTIMVKDGTYAEDIVIDVSVSLMGYGDDDTIISGGGGDDVVNITSGNVVMKGFDINVEDASNGIVINSNNNRLEDMYVETAVNNGIFLQNAEDNDLIDCTLYDNSDHGIYLKSSSDNELINCTSHDNFYGGIYFDSSSNNIIEHCTCYGNYHSFNFLGSSNSNKIVNCTAYGNGRDAFDIGGSSNEITNCTATTSRDGFHMEGSSNKVTDCYSHGNRRCGIYLGGSSHMILDCNSSDNDLGVFSYRSSRHTIANTSFCNNSQQGIRLYQSTNNLVNNNYFDNQQNYYATGASGTRWNITKKKGESMIGGPCLGGNYWSDYTGSDTDGDGIGNTDVPYGPGDYLPLAEPKGENLPPDKPIDCSPGNGAINVTTDITLEVNVSDPNGGQIDVTFHNASDDTVIGKDWGVNNRTASVEWNGLAHDTTYGWYVVVDDSEKKTRSDTWSFTTKERPNDLPAADFEFSPKEILTGDEVRFTDNSTDPDGEIVEWRWDFENDGGVDSNERNPTHRYVVAGEYSVNLTILDDDGGKGYCEKIIIVSNTLAELRGWGFDMRLTHDNHSSTHPQIAVSVNIVHVVWEDNRDPAGVYYKKSEDYGMTWEDDVFLASGGYANIAVQRSNAHVVFASGANLYYKRSTDDGNTWGDDVLICAAVFPLESRSPDIAVSENFISVIWMEGTQWNWDLLYARSLDNGDTWSLPLKICHGIFFSEYPALAAHDNYVHVIWYDYREGSMSNSEIYYKRSIDFGTTWATDIRLTVADGWSLQPDVAASGRYVHVTWYDGRGGFPLQIYHKRSTDNGGTWEEDKNLTNNEGSRWLPRIAAFNDNVHLVWHDGRNGDMETYYIQSRDNGENWEEDMRLTYNENASMRPAVGVYEDDVHVVWGDNRDDNDEIYTKHRLKSANEWWMFHHDIHHTGFSPSKAPDTNQTAWTRKLPNIMIYSTPVIHNDTLYISPYRYLCAINMFTGEEVWTRSLPMGGTTPAVRDGMVFVGIAGNQGHNNRMYAFDEKTGEEIWSFLPKPNPHNNDITSSPAVANGMVYFGSWNARLFAVDEFTGEEVWNYTAMHWIQTSPAVAYGKVFFGDNARNIYAIDAMTGEHLWSYTGTQWILSSPAAANGMVFVGDNGGYFYALDENGMEDGDQGVPDFVTHPLDRSDLIWMKKIGDNGIRSSPAVHNGKVFIASSDGILFALDLKTGDEIWQRRVGDYDKGESVHSSPAVADGKVFIGSGDENVYALDEETGQILWTYKTTKYVRSSPAVAGGMVFVPDHNGYLYAFGTPAEPDLALSREEIFFTPGKPVEGDVVKIEARIHNYGHMDAESADVIFYDGNPDNGGERIGAVQTISVAAQGCRLVSVEWDTAGVEKGEHDIHILVENCAPEESNLANNRAAKTIRFNHPPFISPEIPDPPETDEDTNITINLTDYENDEEDSGTNLSWMVMDHDENAIESITGEMSHDDNLTFVPVRDYSGTTTLELTLVDKDGGTDSQTIDLTWRSVNDPPEVAITDPGEGDTVSGSCEVKGNASDVDGDGQILRVEVRVDDGEWIIAEGTTDWDHEIDTTAYEDGSYTIHARAFDGENYSEPASIELIFDNEEEPGNHRPMVNITEPEDGSVVNETVTIKGRAEDEDGNEDIEKVEVKIGDGSWKDAEGISDWSYEVDTRDYEDNSYTIYARAFDGKDYSETESIELVFDNEEVPGNHRPGVEITDPEDGSVVKDTITIEGRAEDEDGNDDLEKIEVKIGDNDWELADGTAMWSLEIDTAAYYDGTYRIHARAYDGKDYSRIASIELEFDNAEEPQEENHPPTIELASVEKTDDYTYLIAWTASDQDGDTLEIDLYYDTDTDHGNGKNLIAGELDDTGSYDWDISDMGEGNYYIFAVARDPGGEEGSDYSERFSLTFPEKLPDFEITFFQIAAASSYPGENVFIQITVKNIGDDQGSGKLIFTVDAATMQSFDLDLKPGKEKSYNSIWIAVEGNHTIGAEAQLDDDPTPENNRREQVFVVEAKVDDRKEGDEDDFPVIFVGLGSIILLGVVGGILFAKKKGQKSAVVTRCPGCGGETQYSEEENDHYCWECEKYIGEMNGEMEEEVNGEATK